MRKVVLLIAVASLVEGVGAAAAQSIDARKGCARDWSTTSGTDVWLESRN